MPSKDKIDVVMTPESRSDFDSLVAAAEGAGLDLTYAQTSGRNSVNGKRVRSDSLVARLALAMATDRVRPLGALRLRRAKEARGLRTCDVAREAGVSRSHVRAVLCGSVRLSPTGKLRAWLDQRESAA